jgi:Fe-S cluster biosynthesis and repair protein YggX
MQHEERISRFKYMTDADPDNELAHFSLGKAYLEADLFVDAIASFKRVLELNQGFSKAYALMGYAQRRAGDVAAAAETLTKGYLVAHERGDLMPRNDMAQQLKEIGAKVPEAQVAALTPELAAAGNIQCRRCGRIAPKMAERPFGGALGEQIHLSICGSCFKEWIGQGTKVINELRLNLTEPAAQDVYDQHMKEFLNIE